MHGVKIDTERLEIIEKFWQDPGVRECFARRNEFQLTDSASYFLDNARRIVDEEYQPTDLVCLHQFLFLKKSNLRLHFRIY